MRQPVEEKRATYVAAAAGRTGVVYILGAYAAFLGLPALAYIALGARVPVSLRVVHFAVATGYALTSAMMLIEAGLAFARRQAPVPHATVLPDVPLVSVIVSAYLPNEQDLIAETILHLATEMDVSGERLQIILAYNAPDELPVERTLEAFRDLNVAFTPLRVPGSRSKAENILAALPLVKGEMTVLLDADHRPLPDAIERAYRWLLLGYDIVQGRCVVRRQTETLLTRYVSVEFEHMYSVAHTGRSLAVDTAIFGGTNGYWRTSALRKIGMDPHMLTEDIDSSVRALLAGYRVVHDRSIVSSELATPDFRRWWSQRLRWAQGWFQVTLRHQRALWQSPRLGPKAKLYWTYLLSWRELFPFLSLQVFGLLIASWALRRPIDWLGHPYLVATTFLTLAAGPVSSLATYRVALWRTKRRLGPWFVLYALTNLPYVTLKNTVSMVAMIREFRGRTAWVVTARSRLRPGEAV